MNQKQLDLINEVSEALRDPKSSPYYGMEFQRAADLLRAKLEEVKQIEAFEKAKQVI